MSPLDFVVIGASILFPCYASYLLGKYHERSMRERERNEQDVLVGTIQRTVVQELSSCGYFEVKERILKEKKDG